MTIVLLNQDMVEGIALGYRIAVMDRGRLLQHGTPVEILAKPEPGFVERLVGDTERPFRLLSLTKVADVAEPGEAKGSPISGQASLREALSEVLARGTQSVPVTAADGSSRGRVTLSAIISRARLST